MAMHVIRESLEKVDITVNSEDDTVRYRQVRFYKFQPTLSSGKESDKVTFINIAYVVNTKNTTNDSMGEWRKLKWRIFFV
jgi:hypothetical protein